jgi:hypothetical protein
MARHELILYRGTVSGAGTTVGTPAPTQDAVTSYTLAVNVSAASSAGTDTLDVYVDGWLAGAWVNLVHFAQVLGNGGPQRLLAALSVSTVASAPAVATADASAGQARLYGIPPRLRARLVTAGSGSFTVTVAASGM